MQGLQSKDVTCGAQPFGEASGQAAQTSGPRECGVSDPLLRRPHLPGQQGTVAGQFLETEPSEG